MTKNTNHSVVLRKVSVGYVIEITPPYHAHLSDLSWALTRPGAWHKAKRLARRRWLHPETSKSEVVFSTVIGFDPHEGQR